MNKNKILHLLNGQAMFDYFRKTHFLEGELMVPFNEAMCYGDTCLEIFSQQFSSIRAKVHHVTPDQYYEITLKPLEPLFSHSFEFLSLWFDADMFCQINIITLLAWLDRTKYRGDIDLNIVGAQFELKERMTLNTKGFHNVYKQVLIQKVCPEMNLPEPINRGVKLYLNYLREESDLMCYIKKSYDIPDKALVAKLIEEFKDYGLGDTQYLELIESVRKM